MSYILLNTSMHRAPYQPAHSMYAQSQRGCSPPSGRKRASRHFEIKIVPRIVLCWRGEAAIRMRWCAAFRRRCGLSVRTGDVEALAVCDWGLADEIHIGDGDVMVCTLVDFFFPITQMSWICQDHACNDLTGQEG